MVNSFYIPNLVSLSHSHGLEETLEAHGCGHFYQGVRGSGDRPGERPKWLLNRPPVLCSCLSIDSLTRTISTEQNFLNISASLLAHDGVLRLDVVLQALHERLARLVGHGAAADLLRLHGGHAVPVLVRLVVNWDKDGNKTAYRVVQVVVDRFFVEMIL